MFALLIGGVVGFFVSVLVIGFGNGITIVVKNIADYKEPIIPPVVEKAITTGTKAYDEEVLYNQIQARKAKEQR